MEENDRVGAEQRRHDDREAGEVLLHDVRPALRGGREAHASEAGLAARVHENEGDEDGRQGDLEHGRDLQPNCGDDEHDSRG